ncbi:MAG: hypothetical protein J6X55_12755 [Victivallales bacterium]|nr:hypothetical protein [Victivallales bacterium]
MRWQTHGLPAAFLTNILDSLQTSISNLPMKLSRIHLACCLSIVVFLACFADDMKESHRTVLFDFTHGKPGAAVPGWEHLKWIADKENEADFTYGEGSALLHLQPYNLETQVYYAPNRHWDFPQPQDWTDYNFLELDVTNPATETNSLRIDLYTVGTKRDAAVTVQIPAGDSRTLVPLAFFAKFREPANLRQVTRISLLRRELTRPIDFAFRKISLVKLQPKSRSYQLDGGLAWQFGKSGQQLQPGLTLVTPDSSFWKSGNVKAIDEKNPRLCTYGPLAVSGIFSQDDALLELPVPQPGDYRVVILIHGIPSNIFDTRVAFSNGTARHIVVGNSYAEYLFTDVHTDGTSIPLTLTHGELGPWGLTAAVILPIDKADTLMQSFVWPMIEDIMVAPWEIRSMASEIITQDEQLLLQHDIYREDSIQVDNLHGIGRQLIFSICPAKDTGDVRIALADCKGPNGQDASRLLSLTAALDYTLGKGMTYRRFPRHFRDFDEWLSLRGGRRQFFAIEAPTAPSGTYSGHIDIAGIEGLKTIPFTFEVHALRTSPDYNTFLYYYPSKQDRLNLACMKEAGFSSVELPVLGRILTLPDGTMDYDASGMESFMLNYMKTGFKGRFVPLYLFNPFTTMNRKLGGKNYLEGAEQMEVSANHLVKVVQAVEKTVAKHPEWPKFAYYPFDEYSAPDYVAYFHRRLRSLGVETFSTSVGRYGRGLNLSPQDGLSIACFPGQSFDNPAEWERLRQQADELKVQIYGYTMSGPEPICQRFIWGLRAWEMGMTGFGAWHFNGGMFSTSEIVRGEYSYNFAVFGPGSIMRTIALFGASDGMMDYAALQEAERRGLATGQIEALRKASQRLRTVSKDKLLAWYLSEGEVLLAAIRTAVGY